MANSCDNLIPRALKNILFQLNITCLSLNERVRKSYYDKCIRTTRDRLVVSLNPFKTKLLYRLIQLYLTFITIKFYYLGYLMYRYDYTVDKIWSNNRNFVSSLARGTTKCLNLTEEQKILLNKSTDYQNFLRYERLLYRLGSYVPSVPNTASIGYFLIGSSSFSLIYLGLYLIKHLKPSLDIYDFISDVNKQRRRFQLELEDLIDGLFQVHESVELTNKGRLYEYSPRHKSSSRSISHLWFHTYCNRHQVLDELKNEPSKDKLILDRKLCELLDPVHLGDRWYQRVVRCSYLVLSYEWIPGIVPGTVYMMLCLLAELYTRVSYRIDLIECNVDMNKLTLDYPQISRQPVNLNPFDSDDSIGLYRGYLKSSVSIFELFWIELKLLQPIVLYANLEIAFMVLAGTIILTTYIGLYYYEYMSKMHWLKQIEQQMNGCLIDMEKMTVYQRQHHDNPDVIDDQKNKTLKSLTMTYLNFEMFRRRQKDYQRLTNLLTAQLTSSNVQSIIMCYLTCSTIKSFYATINLASITYIGALSNAYLITGAIRANKILNLMESIGKLLAMGTENSLRHYQIINLWSIQLMTESETRDNYAPHILGISITYDRIVTLNVYLIAVWYIVLAS